MKEALGPPPLPPLRKLTRNRGQNEAPPDFHGPVVLQGPNRRQSDLTDVIKVRAVLQVQLVLFKTGAAVCQGAAII